MNKIGILSLGFISLALNAPAAVTIISETNNNTSTRTYTLTDFSGTPTEGGESAGRYSTSGAFSVGGASDSLTMTFRGVDDADEVTDATSFATYLGGGLNQVNINNHGGAMGIGTDGTFFGLDLTGEGILVQFDTTFSTAMDLQISDITFLETFDTGEKLDYFLGNASGLTTSGTITSTATQGGGTTPAYSLSSGPFTISDGDYLLLRYNGTGAGNPDNGFALEGFTLDTIPEPSTALLIGLGLGALVLRRRQK